MRRISGMAAAAALALAAAGCAPAMPGMMSFSFRPACSPMQWNAYRSTRIMQTRQQVAQIQARYGLSRYNSVGGSSNSLVSGECR
jgi:hypothetical protein